MNDGSRLRADPRTVATAYRSPKTIVFDDVVPDARERPPKRWIGTWFRRAFSVGLVAAAEVAGEASVEGCGGVVEAFDVDSFSVVFVFGTAIREAVWPLVKSNSNAG